MIGTAGLGLEATSVSSTNDFSMGLCRQTSTREIIYETPHVRVIHQFQPSDEVVVTFNEIGQCADGQSFWGDTMLSREGLGSIGVMSIKPNWYPPDPYMAEAIRRTVRIAGYQTLVTYGYSQGGYGALKYSASLSAGTAISLCPQWSISPRDVSGFDDRFTHFYDAPLHNRMRISDGDVVEDAFIMFDPYSIEDAWHAQRICEAVEAKAVLTPFVGHWCARFVVDTGIGRSLFRLLRDTSLDCSTRASQARHLIRDARAKYHGYWIGRGAALARCPNRQDLTRVSLEHAARLSGGNAEALVEIARVQREIGDLDQVLTLAQAAAASVDPHAIHTVLRIWEVLDGIGQGASSLNMMRRSTAALPDNAFLRLHLVKTLLDQRADLTKEAAEETRRAAVSAGPSQMLWQHIAHAYDMLGLVDDRAAACGYLTDLHINVDKARW